MSAIKKYLKFFKKSISKNIKIGIITGISAILIGLIVIYCINASKYSGVFLDGTTINGVDVSGMTAEAVENDIRSEIESYSLDITFRGGGLQTVNNFDINLKYVSDGSVEENLSSQSKFAWIFSKFGKTYEYTAEESVSYDKDALKNTLLSFPELDPDYIASPVDASVGFEDNQFVIVPEDEGNEIDIESALQAIDESIISRDSSIDLDEKGCYLRPKLFSDDEALKKQVDSGNELINCNVTYQFPDGEQRFTGSIIKDWLTFDEAQGIYTLSDETLQQKCTEYISQLAQITDSTSKMNFNSTNYGVVKVLSKDFGYRIDEETEVANLISNIKNHETVTRQPAWEVEGVQFGIGNTYIEVDIASQKVFAYRDGQLIVSSDCVTGTDGYRDTVYGAYQIYRKQTERVLEGPIGEDGKPSYSSFVYFWMPFYKGYGLHDATWRSKFGGNIYTYYGSHGCVNLPYEVAETIFENFDVGTPVIVFKYDGENIQATEVDEVAEEERHENES